MLVVDGRRLVWVDGHLGVVKVCVGDGWRSYRRRVLTSTSQVAVVTRYRNSLRLHNIDNRLQVGTKNGPLYIAYILQSEHLLQTNLVHVTGVNCELICNELWGNRLTWVRLLTEASWRLLDSVPSPSLLHLSSLPCKISHTFNQYLHTHTHIFTFTATVQKDHSSIVSVVQESLAIAR